MGGQIMGAIAGGLSEGSIASAVSGSQEGISYGFHTSSNPATLAGYAGWVGQQISQFGGSLLGFSMGPVAANPVSVTLQGAIIPQISQDIADALESGVFGQITGPYIVLPQPTEDFKVPVMGPPIPMPPVMFCP